MERIKYSQHTMRKTSHFEPKWHSDSRWPEYNVNKWWWEEEEAALEENNLVKRAMSAFLVMNPMQSNLDVLSIQKRGMTLAGWNEDTKSRNIIRVSRYKPLSSPMASAKDISGQNQCSQRIHLFGQFVMDQRAHGQEIPGIVRFVHAPTVMENGLLVEQYEEVVCASKKNRRLDLHAFVMENMDGDNARRGFGYLHDVLRGIVSLHEKGWVHMDLSLENVVVSDEHAFMIDFESVLPFDAASGGFLKRRDIGVPLKAPFVPPEHYMSRQQDVVDLPSYDVWAFGIMFFTVLFREYLFALRTVTDAETGNEFVMPVSAQIRYFMAEGFESFLVKYHPDKHLLLFETDRVRCKEDAPIKLDARVRHYLHQCGDLLSKMFERPETVVLGMEDGDGECVEKAMNGGRRKKRHPARYFCTCNRLTAREVFEHPFWEDHGIR